MSCIDPFEASIPAPVSSLFVKQAAVKAYVGTCDVNPNLIFFSVSLTCQVIALNMASSFNGLLSPVTSAFFHVTLLFESTMY